MGGVSMIRILGGIVAGMAAAITFMMIVEAIGNQVAPAPAAGNAAFPVIGTLLGALVGGFLAIRVSDQPWTAWALAAAVLVATVFNFLLMDYAAWVIVAGLVAPLLGAWLAQRFCAMAERRTRG
jgi:hypothetical protein